MAVKVAVALKERERQTGCIARIKFHILQGQSVVRIELKNIFKKYIALSVQLLFIGGFTLF